MKLYSYSIDYGRMGVLDGLFFATDEELDAAEGNEVYMDDVLGKHSEISFTFDRSVLTEIELSQECINVLMKATGKTVSGYNLLEYAFDE